MKDKYEINKKDIESVINFLEIADPPNANHETAILILEEMQQGFREMREMNPDKLIELYSKLKKRKITQLLYD